MMRLGGTAVLFAIALVLFVVAAVTHEAWPLFVAWAPLIGVPWLLTRPEAGSTKAATVDPSEPPEADAAPDAPPASAGAEPNAPGDPEA
jgi:hypothetical protein